MFLPNAEERDIVIFKLWPSLPYKIRLPAGICLIALGLQQFSSISFMGVNYLTYLYVQWYLGMPLILPLYHMRICFTHIKAPAS